MNDAAWVEWMTTIMGGVSRQPYAATFPPDRFYCVLDELPMHLVRRSLRVSWNSADHDDRLRLNPECVICPAGELPPEVASRPELVAGFGLQGTIAWVRDLTSATWLPFWLGPELDSLVQRI